MEIILLNKRISSKLIQEYEEILGVQDEIENMDFQMCRVWYGTGSASIHNYPIENNKTNIYSLVEQVNDVMKYIEEVYCIKTEYKYNWEYNEDDLVEVNKESINIYVLTAFAIILYGKEKAIFKIANVLADNQYMIKFKRK